MFKGKVEGNEIYFNRTWLNKVIALLGKDAS